MDMIKGEAMKKANAKHKGLTSNEAEASRRENGANILSERKSKSFLRCFFENLGDPVIRILLAALAVNLLLVLRGGDIIETIGIAISVFLATFISTVSEKGSEAAFRKLDEECSHSSFRVWRDGALCEIPIEDIVVGDIISISAGEQIPADAFVVSGNLRIDQSMITGESREINKICSTDRTKLPSSKSAVFRGCTVLSGEAEIEVFSVGENSFLGKISDEVKLDTRESPLKLRLSVLAKQISRISYLAAILIALAYLFNTFIIDSGFTTALILRKIKDIPYLVEHLLHALMLALTVVVMAVPEGLPMMIAVVLSSNMRRMIKDNVLVRKPMGIEAAGSMNILFTDKTGTLTEGKMSVGLIIDAECNKYSSAEKLKKETQPIFEQYRYNAIFNGSSTLSENKAIGGNATEKALLESLIGDRWASAEAQVKKRLPFQSKIKYSAAHIYINRDIYLVKGAPEKLLQNCKYALSKDGKALPFSSVSYRLAQEINSLTSSGGRVICIAESNVMPDEKKLGELTFICAVLLSDKIRDEARASTEKLERAGVQVVMITGDNRDTAEYIANRCGIITPTRNKILTSDELATLSDEQVKKLLPKLAVLARALPSDKSRLVRIAQEMGLVTGMTGDGINDAPALKRADIGFSMGSGTEVSKEAGDIIIIDNNLSSIAKAVLYGRTIFKSIRKFITLQLTMNLCAVGISMIGPFIGYDSPVTVVQMLWINIIMDTLGGLAFAGEAPKESYMKEKPKRRDEPILNRYMIGQIAFSGVFTVGLYIFFLLSPMTTALFRSSPDKIYLLTAFFALFIFTSVLHCFGCRTDRMWLFSGISKNKAFISIITLVCAVQIGFIYLGGAVLRTAPLTVRELIITLLLSLCVVPAELLRKAFLRLWGKKKGF